MMQEDKCFERPLVQTLVWDALYYLGEPVFNSLVFKRVRNQALQITKRLIDYEDHSSRYISLACVMKVCYFLFLFINHSHN